MRSMVRFVCALGLISGFPLIVRAEGHATGEVDGLVMSGKTPAPFANVIVLGTRRGAQADERGYYRITEVPAGRQTLRFMISRAGKSYMISDSVMILPGQTVRHDFGFDDFTWQVPKGRTFELRVGEDCRARGIPERRQGVYHKIDSSKRLRQFQASV